jgi:hypothetical protein
MHIHSGEFLECDPAQNGIDSSAGNYAGAHEYRQIVSGDR